MKRTCLLTGLLLFAAPILLPAQPLIFKNYTVQDGLVANAVRCIFQDSKGFIWIATWEGLSKYDGYKFTNFTTANGLSHNLVNDLFEDNGKLFVALNDGTLDVIQNDRIKKIFSIPSPFNRFLRLQNGITLLTTDKDGFYEYRNGNFFKPYQRDPRQVCEDIIELNNDILIGSASNDSIYFFHGNYQLYSKITTTDQSIIFHLYKDSKKRTWLCTNKGLKLLSPSISKSQSKWFLPLPPPFNIPLLNHHAVSNIFEDRSGIFWIGAPTGLIKMFPDGHYTIYTAKDGLASSSFLQSSIFEDRENNLWIGNRDGLAKISLQNYIQVFNLTQEENKDMTITGVVPRKKNLLLTTSNGIFEMQTHFGQLRNIVHFSQNDPYRFVAGNQSLLLYNNEGLSHLDTVTNHIKPIKPRRLDFLDFTACTDSSGNSFIGLVNKIAVFTKDKLWIKNAVPDRILDMVADKNNNLWVGTFESGLYRVHYSFTKDSVIFLIQNFSNLVGDKHIRNLFIDSHDNIWVGTRYSGCFCLSPKNNDGYTVSRYDQSKGLLSNFITAFAETRNGDIWVGTFIGIDKLVKEERGYRIFNFSRVTNFFGLVFSILSENNDWWCAVEGGMLAKFTDGKLENTPPPQAVITSAHLGSSKNKRYVTHVDSTIKLEFFENQAQFTFSAASFINEKQIFYSYRLNGSGDTSWSKPQNIHEVSYASLQDGNYSFDVRTIGWNEQPGEIASFHFMIMAPFWKTYWFVTLCVLALASVFYILYRYRLNQVIKLQRVRNRIATDLHDEIGSSLTNINILSSLSKKNISETEKANEFLKRISEEATASSQALDDIIWSVNAGNDTLEETITRMRRYAAELFDATGLVQYHFDLDESITEHKLNMEQRRDLYLIFKESLNNILKHAAATEVFISIHVSNNKLLLQIKDNGKGFDIRSSSYRNGLKNLRLRTERWKGSIRIDSAMNKGTMVDVSLPIIND